MIKKKKIYSKRAILIATFLGTPLAGGYLMGQNFSVWKDNTAAKISYAFGIVFIILILIPFLFIPSETVERIPRFLVPFICTIVIERLVAIYQDDKIEGHIENENLKQSNWKAAGIGIIGCILAALLFLGISYNQPLYPGALGSSLKQGQRFRKNFISEKELVP